MRKLPGKERFLWDRAVTRTPEEQRLVRRGPLAFSMPRTQSEIFELCIFSMRPPYVKAFAESQPHSGACLTNPGTPGCKSTSLCHN